MRTRNLAESKTHGPAAWTGSCTSSPCRVAGHGAAPYTAISLCASGRLERTNEPKFDFHVSAHGPHRQKCHRHASEKDVTMPRRIRCYNPWGHTGLPRKWTQATTPRL